MEQDVDESVYVTGNILSPANKGELQLWLEKLRIPEVKAAEYTERLEGKGFDDLQALIEDAVEGDLRGVGFLDGHCVRVEKGLEKLRMEWYNDGKVDDNMLTIVVFKGRKLPSSLSPEKLAETVLYSVMPPAAPGTSHLNTIANPNGHMAILQTPLAGAMSMEQMAAISAAYQHHLRSSSHQDEADGSSPLPGGEGKICSSSKASHLAVGTIGESFPEGSWPIGTLNNVREWDVNDVINWMSQFEPLRSRAYEKEIRKRQITGEELLSITSLPQVENLGIRLIPHKKRLLQEIEHLRQTYASHLKGTASELFASPSRKDQPDSEALHAKEDSSSIDLVFEESYHRHDFDESKGVLLQTSPSRDHILSPLDADGHRAYANHQLIAAGIGVSGSGGGGGGSSSSSLLRLPSDRDASGSSGHHRGKGSNHSSRSVVSEAKRRLEEMATSRIGAKARQPSPPREQLKAKEGEEAALGFNDSLDAWGQINTPLGGSVDLEASYVYQAGILKANGFQIEPGGITQIPEEKPPLSARSASSFNDDNLPLLSPRRSSELSVSNASDIYNPLETSNFLTMMVTTPRNVRSNLITLDEIGSGACASVYRAIYLPTLTVVAVKFFPIHDKHKRHQLVQELRSFLPLNWVLLGDRSRTSVARCPHVISFYDAYTDTHSDAVSMVLEYMNAGTLQDLTKRVGRIKNEDFLAWIAYQIAKGLNEIHCASQIHRDIKPSNILLNSKGDIKISDFGIARIIEAEMSFAKTYNGTILYMSPERLNGENYSYSSDIWSFGLTLITLALGHYPLPTEEGFWGIYQAVKAEPSGLHGDQYSSELKDFVSKCCKIDPKERSTAEALLQHDFVKSRLPDLDSSPPTLSTYLPPRPLNLAGLPAPKRKMIKSVVEKAVITTMTKAAVEADALQVTSSPQSSPSDSTLLPHFRDVDLQNLEQDLWLPVDSVVSLFQAEIKKQQKKIEGGGGEAEKEGGGAVPPRRRSRAATASSDGSLSISDSGKGGRRRSREATRSPAPHGGAGTHFHHDHLRLKSPSPSIMAMMSSPPPPAPSSPAHHQRILIKEQRPQSLSPQPTNNITQQQQPAASSPKASVSGRGSKLKSHKPPPTTGGLIPPSIPALKLTGVSSSSSSSSSPRAAKTSPKEATAGSNNKGRLSPTSRSFSPPPAFDAHPPAR